MKAKPTKKAKKPEVPIELPQVIKTKTYSFKVVEYNNGKAALIRHNEGFNVYELLGLISHLQRELYDMSVGKIHVSNPGEFKIDNENKICKTDEID